MALTDNLLAFYKLDDLTDSSGNGNTLTNNGGVTFGSGKIGNAAIMDSSSKVLSKSDFQEGNTFSVTCWAKWLEESQAGLIGQLGLWLAIYDDGSIQVSDLSSFASYSNTGLVALNQWNHYALVATNGHYKVYLNGTVVLEDNTNQVTLWSDAGRGFGIGGEPLNIAGQKEMDAVGVWSRALNSTEVAELYNSGTGLELTATPSVNLNSGLQAFYKLDDTSDSSGNGNTLTNSGGVTFASGKIGNAAVFSKTYAQDLKTDSITETSNYTFSVWLNPYTLDYSGQTENTARPVDLFGSFGPVIHVWPGDKWLYGHSNGGGFTTYEWSATANQWVHIVFSYDGSQTKLYENGNLIFTDGSYVTQNFQAYEGLLLGGGLSNMMFDGQIDAVGIWNRALNSAEIAALYNSGNGYEISASATKLVNIQGNTKFFGNVKFIG